MTSPAIEPISAASSLTATELALRELLGQFLGTDLGDVPSDLSFLEMGVDSLGLLSAAQLIWEKMGVRIPFRMMLDEYPTLSAVAAYIDQQRPVAPDSPSGMEVSPPESVTTEPELVTTGNAPARETPPPVPSPSRVGTVEVVGDASLKDFLAKQLELMRMQLQLLSSTSTSPRLLSESDPRPSSASDRPPAPVSARPDGEHKRPQQIRAQTESFVPYQKLNVSTSDLDRRQEEHLSQLVARYTARTVGSKRLTERYRKVLADNRVSAGFRVKWKEMIYQVLADRAEGCRFWDVDGNEYIDITMGFGAIIFGHSPAFLMEALHRQVEAGIGVGPQSRLAGEVAELLCEMTGSERAAFCNSGTEAVMTALRLARTATGRRRIALFTGSYHGTFDGVLVRGEEGVDGGLRAMPLAPGVPHSMIDDVLLLRYNQARSLDLLKEHGSELAAVLVAPVPSRDPEGHSQSFLRSLREITGQCGTVLIFDEVVTGFRVHPGGAQALHGVRADLVTYGKAVGGGFPIGVVAGKAQYMDAIDGGSWSYGDKSYPKAETTFFAGTFFKHPWVMTAALAVLKEIKRRGTELYDSLALVTSRFADELNDFFRKNDLPFEIGAYASFFMIQAKGEVKYTDLFYYYLLQKGIYVWEGRTCFFSTAHTPEDVELVARAIRESALEMREAGFVAAPPDVKHAAPAAPVAVDKSVSDASPAVLPSRRLPLTEEQYALWAVCQISEESSRAYNEPLCLHLKGRLSLETLRDALQLLVERHEALRSTFDADGQFQTVHSQLPLELPLDDLSTVPSSDHQLTVSRWIESQLLAPFDLQRGPLVRTRLARFSNDHHVFVLVAHHLVVDGWSMGILARELGIVYSALAEGTSFALPEPGHLVIGHPESREAEGPPVRTENEDYWRTTFATGVPILALPTDRPRPRLQTFRGGRVTLKLSAELREATAAAVSKSGATLFVGLLSAYSVLLHRLTGQQEIVIGVPIAGQLTSGNRELVGYCIRMVPIKSASQPELQFSQHVKQIRQRFMEALEHGDVPLSRIAKSLKVIRDPARPSLISACFNLDQRAPDKRWFGLDCECADTQYRSAKFDLDLDAVECPDGSLDLECVYNADLLDAATVTRWMEDYRDLLEEVAAHPHAPLDELEPQSAVRSVSTGQEPMVREAGPKCLHQVFELQALKTPSSSAIVTDGEELTYGELQDRADRLAWFLRAHAAETEKTIGVCLDRSIEQIVALLAVLKSGAAYLPLDPALPALRMHAILNHASPSIIITSPEHRKKFSEFTGCVVDLKADRDALASVRRPEKIAVPFDENLAYIIYTSGSSGTPKGVAVQHSSAVSFVEAGIKAYGLSASDRVLRFAALSSDISVEEIFCTLGCGAALVIANDGPALGSAELFASCVEFGVTVLDLPSGYWHSLVDSFHAQPPSVPDSLRLVILGGERLRAQAVQDWRRLYGERVTLVNSYGPTEATVIATTQVLSNDKEPAEPVPIGRAIQGAQVLVLDDALHLRPAGAIGEICIAGHGVARGYWNDAAQTAAVFVPDPFSAVPGARMYRSGDLGRVDDVGILNFCGRDDEQFKIRGYRVDLGEIESALLQHPDVREAAVKVFDNSPNQRELAAYAVLRLPGGASPSELRSHLQQRLPEYMVPDALIEMERFPKTVSGKIDKTALPAIGGNLQTPAQSRLPSNETEKHLAELWRTVIGVDAIGVDDNFFELGGDSILAIQIASRAAALGIKLTTQMLFEYQTIAALAEAVRSAQKPQPVVEASVLSWPLTPIQSWFFEEPFPNRNHWNQAALLETRENVDMAALFKALETTIQTHPGLTLRFARTSSGIRMSESRQWDPGILSTLDLSDTAPGDRSTALVEHATKIQQSLDIENGPLCRFTYINMGENLPGRLLAVVHHLVIDVVSWRILLADLTAAYHQAQSGHEPLLPASTTTFGEWSRRLSEYAGRPERASELDFWLDERRAKVPSLPLDHPSLANHRSSQRTMERFIGTAHTTGLVRGAPRHLKSPISDVLLAALAIALARWGSSPLSLVDLEAHGREELFPDVNLTRTVGWFTSIYPVLLDGGAGDIRAVLKSVKRELRSIPHAGIGYGILRYLHPDPAVRERFRHQPKAELCFNYLGQLDQVLERSGPFLPAEESAGESQPPDSPQSHLLSLEVSVAGGRLRSLWTYNKDVHEQETIERLADYYRDALEVAASACCQVEPILARERTSDERLGA